MTIDNCQAGGSLSLVAWIEDGLVLSRLTWKVTEYLFQSSDEVFLFCAAEGKCVAMTFT